MNRQREDLGPHVYGKLESWISQVIGSELEVEPERSTVLQMGRHWEMLSQKHRCTLILLEVRL